MKKKVTKSRKRKRSATLVKVSRPDKTLAAVIGAGAMPRTEIAKRIWGYIKRNGLQDKKNRHMIGPDDKLRRVFAGKSSVSIFEVTKLVSRHLR